jgi:heat shock protein HslJ
VAASPVAGGETNGLSGAWQWQSTRAADGTVTTAADPSRYTITFGPGGSLQIRADCNRVLGTYTVNGSSLTLQLGPSTLVGCPPDSQADQFLAGLNQVQSYRIAADNLELGLGAQGTMMLSRMPTPQLVGPNWQLLMYNNGRQAVQSILEGTQPTATFGSDGHMSGSGGCNTFNGPYQTSGRTIAMGPFATTRMACPQPVMDQEFAYLKALENATRYEFVDGRLEMRDDSGALQAQFAAP